MHLFYFWFFWNFTSRALILFTTHTPISAPLPWSNPPKNYRKSNQTKAKQSKPTEARLVYRASRSWIYNLFSSSFWYLGSQTWATIASMWAGMKSSTSHTLGKDWRSLVTSWLLTSVLLFPPLLLKCCSPQHSAFSSFVLLLINFVFSPSLLQSPVQQ